MFVSHWIPALADTVMALGGPHFWTRLSIANSLILQNDGIVVFRYQSGLEPAFIFSDYVNEVARSEFQQYRTSAYLLDPFYAAFLDRKSNGVRLLRDLVADRFFSSEYYKTYYKKIRLIDEAGVFCWVGTNDLVILSCARREGSHTFSSSSIREYGVYVPIVANLVRKHVELTGVASTAERTSDEPKDTMSGSIGGTQLFHAAELTHREIKIANLILRGHSSKSISLVLGISLDTVKTHRRHIFQKLRISSQAELFAIVTGARPDLS